jgi:hypothetical protein
MPSSGRSTIAEHVYKLPRLETPPVDGPFSVAEARLWQFLGPSKDKPFIPFPAQAEILEAVRIPWPGVNKYGVPHPTIYCLECARRFGKTTLGEIFLWEGLLAPDDHMGPPCVRLTADTEEHAMKIWRRFIWHLENTPLSGLLDSYNKEYQLVTLRNGATAQLLSANNPNALAGDGVTLWVIDEAQYLTQAAWVNLFPSTADRNGIIVMLGVCEGEGPFKEACHRGHAGPHRDPAYRTFTYPTSANPYVPKWRIEFARQQLPPAKFRQLYLAQWVGELGKIFRNVEGCVNGKQIQVHPKGWGFTQPYKPGHTYYGGLDLARLQDWTAFTIWTEDGELVAWDRFNLMGWELQKARILELSAAYQHPLTCIDSTGIGDPIYDDLVRKGMNLEEYRITGNEKKRVLIDELAVRIGAGTLRYPRVNVLLAELNRMEAKRSENSLAVKYEAPSGGTDDFVLACALACYLLPPPHVPRPVEAALERERASWEYL